MQRAYKHTIKSYNILLGKYKPKPDYIKDGNYIKHLSKVRSYICFIPFNPTTKTGAFRETYSYSLHPYVICRSEIQDQKREKQKGTDQKGHLSLILCQF
ncbi:unnamed protein product [Gordionus sp. m RMFG-2023]